MAYRVLLVDDNPTDLQLLGQVLNEGYHLLFANSGRTALDAATAHLPDLILLDVGGCQRSCRVRVLNQAASLKASASLFGVSGFRLT